MSLFYSNDEMFYSFYWIQWQIKWHSWFWLAMKHCCHGSIVIERQVVIDDKFYEMGPTTGFLLKSICYSVEEHCFLWKQETVLNTELRRVVIRITTRRK